VRRELEGEREVENGLSAETQGSLRSVGENLYQSDFVSFIRNSTFPCLGAKAAVNAQSFCLRVYNRLASPVASKTLAHDLGRFVDSEMRQSHPYATFVAVFEGPLGMGEKEFEHLLWSQLHLLSQIDLVRNSWDPSVSFDPADPLFSFSFRGCALYVVGMHGNSSRLSRRFRWPTLVFNPHEQFERLRADGQWRRLRDTIRERDMALQGNINPMLSDFGDRSEAAQYSGRATAPGWSPPPLATEIQSKEPSRCPFAH
jgi:FPC/CPF motif-containing protein YcgG